MQNIFDKEFLKELGKNIALHRKVKGLTQLDLAIRMDNHAEQIGRIERGQLNVTICTLKKIAESLEMPLQDLFNFHKIE
ncbi:MAG: helix-turn-helix transcriptional regulator [Ginsengibacter sp.]